MLEHSGIDISKFQSNRKSSWPMLPLKLRNWQFQIDSLHPLRDWIVSITYVPGAIRGRRGAALGERQSFPHSAYSLVGGRWAEQNHNVSGHGEWRKGQKTLVSHKKE